MKSSILLSMLFALTVSGCAPTLPRLEQARTYQDSLQIMGTLDGAAAAEQGVVGSYALPAGAGGALLGFFGLLVFSGHPTPMIGAGAGLGAVLLTSSAASRDAVPSDSLMLTIADRDERYRLAFQRGYHARMNGMRQNDVVIGTFVGMVGGFPLLLKLLTSSGT